MVRGRTLQWMGRVLRMDEDRLPRRVTEMFKICLGCTLYSSAIGGCHEEGSGGGNPFPDLVKLPGHTKLVSWPEIQAAAANKP
eukprot:75605-Chlamydomonas_euryale.AAC.1